MPRFFHPAYSYNILKTVNVFIYLAPSREAAWQRIYPLIPPGQKYDSKKSGLANKDQ